MSKVAARMLATAAIQPDRAAVVTDDATVTYGEFAGRVRQIAAALVPYFQRSGTPVAVIALPQGADAYAAMFAALMAGGFYVPLNLAAPAQRLAGIVSQLNAAVIVTDEEWQDALPPQPVPSLMLRAVGSAALDEPHTPHRLAYVMFTSGSTGTPKGVLISQEALLHYMGWIEKTVRPTAEDRWSQHPNIGFDLSVLDIYGALLFGAALYPLVSETARMLPALWAGKHQLTIWNSVPSVVSLMMQASQANAANLSSVRLFTFCGEPLLPEQVAALFAAAPNATVQNTYGPTEATVSCTELPMTKETWRRYARHSVALGRPIAGMDLHLHGPDAPLRGELVITGPQLADGYWGSPQQAAAAFRPLRVDGAELPAYFTGDMVEQVEGDFYFLARRDRQVKIHGFRVELDDVHAALRRCGYAQSAVAMVGDDLHGFVEAAPREAFDTGVLKKQLLEYIDSYAIPVYFHVWERLPRNDNGKLDLQAMIRAAKAQAPKGTA